MELENLVNPSIVIVDYKLPMRDCVKVMIDKNISSVLVSDQDGKIVGIITERDIVRKFTLLDVGDKLDRTAGTVMTRPVKFVRRDYLFEDILKLHMDLKVRHFPIQTADNPTEDNIAGMLSVTDILRFLFKSEKLQQEATVKAQELPIIELGLLTQNESLFENYHKIFSQLRMNVTHVQDFGKYVANSKTHHPIIFDLDSFMGIKRNNLIPAVMKYQGYLLIVTSDVNALQSFRKYANKDRQAAAIKPLDFTYVNWLIREKWAQS